MPVERHREIVAASAALLLLHPIITILFFGGKLDYDKKKKKKVMPCDEFRVIGKGLRLKRRRRPTFSVYIDVPEGTQRA